MFKKVLLGLLLSNLAFYAGAQDFHFSQFYNSPLTLNPSLSGRIKEDYRAGIIHRSQWKAVNSSFITSAVFADINFIKNPFKLDMWSVGLVGVNDEIGDGIFSNQQVSLALSGVKTLDELKRHRISFGVQPSYVTKGLNTNNFVFDSQIKNYQSDQSISSGEQLSANRYSFFNLNAGLFYDFVLSRKVTLFTGYSANNVLRPKESPLATSSSQLPVRHTLNPGFIYTINKKWSVTPNFLFMYQAKAVEANLGLYGAFIVNPEKTLPTTLFLGAWYRTRDAFIPMGGVKWGHYQVAFSYDFTASSLRDVRNAPTPMISRERASVGAWEISFIYVGFLKRALPNETTIPCKFF